MIWVEAAKKYLAAFAAKDEKALEEMYSSRVELRDGFSHLTGKEDVIAANAAAWNVFERISIRVQSTCYRDRLICVEYVMLADANTANFLTVIEFNSFGKISSVRTYRQ